MINISLPVGKRIYLPTSAGYVWESDNANVQIPVAGVLVATDDVLTPNGVATVTAMLDSIIVETYSVTIVNWIAEVTKLSFIDQYALFSISPDGSGGIFIGAGTELYQSTDGLETLVKICDIPESQTSQKILITPKGYFYRAGTKVYRSVDLISWTLSFTAALGGLYHSMDYYYDTVTDTVFIYLCEYSGLPNYASEKHKVYRGVVTSVDETWTTILDFYSQTEYNADKSKTLWAFHVHLVKVDPYTGHVWVGTGDDATSSRLSCSVDNGQTFSTLGMGTQDWRSLAVWFTTNYVYWNMDSTDNQKVWRIPRSSFNGAWPSMTPILTTGNTIIGVTYQVIVSDGTLPVTAGNTYVENKVRTLSAGVSVRPIDDLSYYYKEVVAELHCGSQWYITEATDQNGEQIIIMASAVEGELRDEKCRMFGIKEKTGGFVEAQELYATTPSIPGDAAAWQTRLEPKLQDGSGYIYFLGINTTPTGIWKMQLSPWNSDIMPPIQYYFRSEFQFRTL